MLEENPLADTSCASTSSAVSDGGRACGIVVGSRVLAKWDDGLWFPGRVSEVGGDGRLALACTDAPPLRCGILQCAGSAPFHLSASILILMMGRLPPHSSGMF